MKKFLLMFLLATGVCAAGDRVEAGRRAATSRYGEWVRVNHNGTTTYRYVYRGYTNGFPPPAMYYYGYPQSGYTYGTGL